MTRGVRGIRFSLGDPATAVVTPDMVEPLARRVADLGWHVQFNVEGEQIVELADLLRRLPTPLVFDHLGHPPLPAGVDHPSHGDHPRPDRPGPGLGQALGRLFEQPGRSALPGRDPDRAGLREGGARAAGVGQRLAASRRSARPKPTTRCSSICCRSGRRTKRRATASSSRIRQPCTDSPRRPRDRGRLAARAAHRRRRRASYHDRTGSGELGRASGLARSARHLARLPGLRLDAVDPVRARARGARHRSTPLHAEPHRAHAVRRAYRVGRALRRRDRRGERIARSAGWSPALSARSSAHSADAPSARGSPRHSAAIARPPSSKTPWRSAARC